MKSRNKGIALSYIHLIVNMICGLFLSSYLIKRLGETEYGIYQTVASFANYLVLLEFGTGTVMAQSLSACRGKSSSKEKINKTVSTIWTITNVLAVVILVASVVMFFFIDKAYSKFTAENIKTAKEIFVLVTINLLVSFYAQSLSGIPLSFEKYHFSPIIKICSTASRTVLIGAIVFKYRYALVIVVIDIFISLCTLLVSYGYVKKHLGLEFSIKNYDSKVFKTVLPLSVALFLQSLINQANNNVDKMFIGMFISPEAVTLYSVPMYIFSVFCSVGTVPYSMYSTQIVKAISSGTSPDGLMDKYISASKLSAVVCGSIFCGFISAGKPFVKMVYGEQFEDAWIIAIILMLPSLLIFLMGVLSNVLDALGKRMIYTFVLTGNTLLNIILTIVLLKPFGYIGAAVATSFCSFVQLFIMMWFYTKKIKIKVWRIFLPCFEKIIPFEVVATIAGYFVSNLIPCNNIRSSLLSLFSGGGVYVVVFALLYFTFDKEAKKTIGSILKRQTKPSY